MEYPAHIHTNDLMEKILQYVGEHCRNTAIYAGGKSVPDIKNVVHLAALLHDMGKYTAQFKEYIEKAADGIDVRRGSVNHTFAGVRFVMEQWHKSGEQSLTNLTAELIAYAIGAHHGQFDCINPEGINGYSYRMEKEGIDYQEAKQQFLIQCTGEEELNQQFSRAVAEVTSFFVCCDNLAATQDELYFYLSLFARLILSLVIDGDRTDTAIFSHGLNPNPPRDLQLLWNRELKHIDRLILNMSKNDSELNSVRKNISDQCCKSPQNNGVFRLSVPTGGGKTLTSLRYAITTAQKYKKKRIFFVIPLLTVLEQNAAVIREALEDSSIVLEHHSNILHESASGDETEFNETELLMDSWNAPVVITTMVQLLNTLFSGKTSCIRRMNAFADSVIIIDEVQSVPIKLLSVFNLAINFLSQMCNANIVLCSATQPCLEKVNHALQYDRSADLVRLTPEMQCVFRRTDIIDRRCTGGYAIDELADFSIMCMENEGNSLLICNTKSQAKQIYDLVKTRNVKTFHLSTSMCMAHRRQTLEEIQMCLKRKERFVCISTQLVEAGVDFSFRCVIRISAGLDNVVQAAGRCNRNGESEKIQPVYIVNVREENLMQLTEIRETQKAAETVLFLYKQNSERFQNDLLSAPVISEYYQRLYTDLSENRLDYYVKTYDTTIYSMLSDNQKFVQKNRDSVNNYSMIQSLKTAGEEFIVFEDDTQDVLVPYDDGEQLILELGGRQTLYDFQKRKELLQKVKPYSISLYSHEVKKLFKSGGLYSICDNRILVLQPEFYSLDKGFSIESEYDSNNFLEV